MFFICQKWITLGDYICNSLLRLDHVVGGSTGPGYSLTCFEKKINKYCHLTLCLRLMELNRECSSESDCQGYKR